MAESPKVSAPEVSHYDIDYINRRLDKIEKKMKIIVSLLAEKKLIGPTLQKAIEESQSVDIDKLIDWLMEQVQNS
jgi:tetrahydromethanopterin S-methyltransferase subunit G